MSATGAATRPYFQNRRQRAFEACADLQGIVEEIVLVIWNALERYLPALNDAACSVPPDGLRPLRLRQSHHSPYQYASCAPVMRASIFTIAFW